VAIWFRQPDIKCTFTAKFNGTSNIQDKLFYVIAEFVPTTFEAGTSFVHAQIEEDSTLTEKTITYSKYIKPPHLRSTNQKVAHVIFGFNDCNSANRVIEYGMYIEGKEIKVHKHLSEPRRCLKCQHLSHYIPDCKNNTNTCARCNRQHHTTTCTTTDPKDFECTNCTGKEAKGHGAANRNCPTFVKEKEKMQERFLENKYKYFPSSSPCTWCLLNQPRTTHDRTTAHVATKTQLERHK
jgi:hypothetical protein